MNKIVSIVVIGIIIVAALAWGFASRTPVEDSDSLTPTTTPQNSEAPNITSTSTATTSAPVSAYTTRYTADGFSPETMTVPRGTTVTFINQGDIDMWVGADEHPSHTNYDGTSREEHCVDGTPSTTSFDQCGVGSTYSFTFTKSGTFDYHNHRRSAHHGAIVVE